MLDIITELTNRINLLESRLTDMTFDKRNIAQTQYKIKNKVLTQQTGLFAPSTAFCVETIDPWRRNRVRIFHPLLHNPGMPVDALPWARPISTFGGFDDCGVNWVPPAGSTVVVVFEHGDRNTPFYLGTTWKYDRGPGGSYFPYPMPEFDAIHKGHRKGYLVGPDDESQEYPPWNTESYNVPDFNINTESPEDFLNNTDLETKITAPNIYGFKTPGKHMFKNVDGNPKCNNKGKRMELLSGNGNWLIFKDDHIHAAQFTHPSCGQPGGDVSSCSSTITDFATDPFGKPLENLNCSGQTSNSSILGGHPSTPSDPNTKYANSNKGNNPYFKHANECRPYKGPGTPQNNRFALPQSGIQILSIAGHTIYMDDSVEEPRGEMGWERSLEDFDFGCNNKFLGVFAIKSATGHKIILSDVEEASNLRGVDNYIKIQSATGNSVVLNDHTISSVSQESCIECPPNLAGEQRGITLTSTSNHTFKMIDHLNEQCSPCRAEGGVPVSKATRAYVETKTGYGMSMRFSDDFSQQETQSQWLQITHPQCANGGLDESCNKERGPHLFRMQGRPQGEPGVIYLRAGGHCIRQTYDQDVVIVGDANNNPSDKYTYVSKNNVSITEKIQYSYADLHVFFAEKQIILMAGRDCPPPPEKTCWGPCVYPVIIARCPQVCPVTGFVHWADQSVSERVFASGYNGCNPPSKGKDGKCTEDNETQTINTGVGDVTF